MMKQVWIIGLIVGVLAGAGYWLNKTYSKKPEEAYKENIKNIAAIEKATPTKFLIMKANYSKNWLGTKFKIKGTISNRATIVSYKDIVIGITYYSKTKSEIGKTEQTLFEAIAAGASIDINIKIENLSKTDSIGWKIISAIAN
jgi:hypothetical protein